MSASKNKPGKIINALSIDVEDWFCVHNFSKAIKYDQWDSCELRVENSIDRLLGLFDRYNVKATFFVLGWIAKKCPDMVKKISASGHEIACHGFKHLIVKDSTPEDFAMDLKSSLEILRSQVSTPIIGFRAPSFSVTVSKPWIFEILAANGIKYDSSLYPVALHPDYANAKTPLGIHKTLSGIVEFPMSCFRFMGVNWPCSGGGYLRLMPYAYSSMGIRRINKEGRPAVIYVHPWEFDPGQPRIKDIPLSKKLRHYINLDKTENRLEKLMQEFSFNTCASVLGM